MYPRCTYDMAVSSHQFVDKKIAENWVLVYTTVSHGCNEKLCNELELDNLSRESLSGVTQKLITPVSHISSALNEQAKSQ